MPDYEKALREKTFKDQCDTTEQRVFYTLTEGVNVQLGQITPAQLELWLHRTTKTLGILLAHLEATGQLTPAKLDEILFRVVL